ASVRVLLPPDFTSRSLFWFARGAAMANLGFFQWVREGVRRSVLLGFSDAVEQLGAPTAGSDISPHLLAVLRESAPAVEHKPVVTRVTPKPERKRLGRSLEQIRDTAPKSTT